MNAETSLIKVSNGVNKVAYYARSYLVFILINCHVRRRCASGYRDNIEVISPLWVEKMLNVYESIAIDYHIKIDILRLFLSVFSRRLFSTFR